jgi:hypothetical protein
MSAMNASSMAPTLNASVIPSPAPRAAASMTFTSGDSTSMSSDVAVSGSPVSGYMIFATTSAAGADMTDAARRCPAMSGKYATSIPTYAAMTPPATVANPPVITAMSSDMVIRSMNGLISSGASV